MRIEITLIRKLDPDRMMSKRIFLDERGAPKSDGSQCLMVNGLATRAEAGTAAKLAELIVECGSDQAIALGALNDELPSAVRSPPRGGWPSNRVQSVARGGSSTTATVNLPGRSSTSTSKGCPRACRQRSRPTVGCGRHC
jgi:hypothetical protein